MLSDGSGRCRKFGIKYTEPPTCYHHGGAAPQVREAARRRGAESEANRKARKALADLEIARIGNPVEEMISLTSELRAQQAWVLAEVGRLRQLEATADDSRLRGLVQLWSGLTDKVHRLLRDWIALGLEDRYLRVRTEQLGEYRRKLGIVINDTIDNVGLPAERLQLARQMVAAHLRAIAAEDEGRDADAVGHRDQLGRLLAEARALPALVEAAPPREGWPAEELAWAGVDGRVDAPGAVDVTSRPALPAAAADEQEWSPCAESPDGTDELEVRAARWRAQRVLGSSDGRRRTVDGLTIFGPDDDDSHEGETFGYYGPDNRPYGNHPPQAVRTMKW